jgi:putative redox protein
MLEDELYEARNDHGNSVMIDMREKSLKQHQSPVELLLSSLAGCGAVDIVVILKKRKKTITKMQIETTGVRKDETPRSFTKIHCKFIVTSPDVTKEELYKTAHLSLEKYCSVAATLRAEITFSVEVLRD